MDEKLSAVKATAMRRLAWAAAPLAFLYSWLATGIRPFTAPAFVVTFLTGTAVILAGTLFRRRHPATEEPAASWAGWVIVSVTLAAWELAAFLQLPRAGHPTLSSLANQVFDNHGVRAGAFLLWVAAGWGIARR